MRRTSLAFSVLAFAVSTAAAQSELQKALKDLDIAPHWIYDDFPRAQAEAKKAGKPLLVIMRCVPCPPGRSLDQKVMQPDARLEELERQFVCVRLVQTNGMDLKLFQYDYDQSWAALFLSPDLAVYGRYGTRTASGPKSDSHLSVPSFTRALERALAIHKGYPGNKELLAGKVGKAPDHERPERIPGLEDKGSRATTPKSCIHCHMVREFALRAKWNDNKLTRSDLFVYPMPDNIGLTMDGADGLVVKSVKADSPAARAGFAVGDEIVALNAQPLTSLADIQWVLHTIPDETKLAASVRRAGKVEERTVSLTGPWKESDIGWRASSWYALRQGLKTEPVPPAERARLGLKDDNLALAVKGMFGKGGPKLQKAGLRPGDVIIAIDGKTAPMTESQFLVYLRLTHGPKDSVRLTVLRAGMKEELTIPMW